MGRGMDLGTYGNDTFQTSIQGVHVLENLLQVLAMVSLLLLGKADCRLPSYCRNILEYEFALLFKV